MVERKTVGKYTLLKRLGKGGMGTVYKALSPRIDKIVALKLLNPSEALEITLGYEKLEEIFLFEAQTLAALNHPHLTTVWDYDKDEQDRTFFVMEYYCNNLGEMIGEQFEFEKPSRQIMPEKVIHYGTQILDALAYLHHHSVVHRDIKPHNILVANDDRVKVCDFGMALVEGVSFSGPSNMQVGSPCYSPPEQKKNPQAVDGRADCYSTAVLLYRMLTGTLPGMQSFPLSQINPVYTEDWDEFFRIGLNWNPADRFQSAGEMKSMLASLPIAAATTDDDIDRRAPARTHLRATPENRCGRRALQAFNLTSLNGPSRFIENDFEILEDLVYDRTTDLTWQKQGSRYPITWQQSLLYIEALSKKQFGGLKKWRLPTLDELLSLLPITPDAQLFVSTEKKWIWSCDLHGKNESWFINFDMGYAASQDRDCPNFVFGVCSGPPASSQLTTKHPSISGKGA